LLLQRCPRCREGKVFKGAFAMNEPCPVCGLAFQREEGYFLGAMYTSYALAVLIVVPLFFLTQWLLPGWRGEWVALIAVLPYLPLTPLVFRYSRLLWIYLDRYADPGEWSSPRAWSSWKQLKHGRRSGGGQA
jgi:uncharacterized protein (DUF983 family)